jgi:hypothetical protein
MSIATVLVFALFGLGSIAGASAALYYLVIKNDKGDEESTTAEKPTADVDFPTSGSELNLEAKALIKRLLALNQANTMN